MSYSLILLLSLVCCFAQIYIGSAIVDFRVVLLIIMALYIQQPVKFLLGVWMAGLITECFCSSGFNPLLFLFVGLLLARIKRILNIKYAPYAIVCCLISVTLLSLIEQLVLGLAPPLKKTFITSITTSLLLAIIMMVMYLTSRIKILRPHEG